MHADDFQFPDGVLIVLEVLDSHDCEYQLRTVEKPAHHAKEAADLLGCPLGAVVKSLIFTSKYQDNFVLVLVSGQNRADKKKLEEIIGQQISPAKPDKVLAFTGYSIGAVPPFGKDFDFPVIIDQDLMAHSSLWASAGSPHILVNFESSILKEITGGKIFDIKEI